MVTLSPEGSPNKAKEAPPSPHEVRLAPVDTNTVYCHSYIATQTSCLK